MTGKLHLSTVRIVLGAMLSKLIVWDTVALRKTSYDDLHTYEQSRSKININQTNEVNSTLILNSMLFLSVKYLFGVCPTQNVSGQIFLPRCSISSTLGSAA